MIKNTLASGRTPDLKYCPMKSKSRKTSRKTLNPSFEENGIPTLAAVVGVEFSFIDHSVDFTTVYPQCYQWTKIKKRTQRTLDRRRSHIDLSEYVSHTKIFYFLTFAVQRTDVFGSPN